MSTTNRNKLVEDLNQAVRDSGNIGILFTNAIAQHMGLSATEFECCSVIQDEGPLTAGEIARRSGLTTGGTTGMIDRLEKMGFVKRTPDPNDRRRVLVSSIEDPEKVKEITELYGPMQEAFDAVLDSYSDRELAVLLGYFSRMNPIIKELTLRLSQTNKECKFFHKNRS